MYTHQYNGVGTLGEIYEKYYSDNIYVGFTINYLSLNIAGLIQYLWDFNERFIWMWDETREMIYVPCFCTKFK